MKPTPSCPYCGAKGLHNIEVTPHYNKILVVYCALCGAIHGIMPYVPPAKAQPSPPPQRQPAVKPPLRRKQPLPPTPAEPPQDPFPHFMDEIGYADFTKLIAYGPEVDSPHCPHCHVEMRLVQIGAGYPNSGKSVWVCPQACGRWMVAVS